MCEENTNDNAKYFKDVSTQELIRKWEQSFFVQMQKQDQLIQSKKKEAKGEILTKRRVRKGREKRTNLLQEKKRLNLIRLRKIKLTNILERKGEVLLLVF